MRLFIVLPGCEDPRKTNTGWELRPTVATLGTFSPVNIRNLRYYIQKYPLSWVHV
jgi:hypothetical protein